LGGHIPNKALEDDFFLLMIHEISDSV
jgi:hypothetical protein